MHRKPESEFIDYPLELSCFWCWLVQRTTEGSGISGHEKHRSQNPDINGSRKLDNYSIDARVAFKPRLMITLGLFRVVGAYFDWHLLI